ncbi:hypothetical protein GCM10010430_73430 [Kitasatospora cystarginea]|uniref:Uncharacterized protein n=1 Tax=Kitasatospora cystarginea TaxID=58350 RepID=A0ABP5RX72_9ACTN
MEIGWPLTEKPSMRSVLTMPGIMSTDGDTSVRSNSAETKAPGMLTKALEHTARARGHLYAVHHT